MDGNKAAPWASAIRPSRDAVVIGDTSHLRAEVAQGEWFITVPGEPLPKDRHRSGNGRHYATARQVAAEALICRCAIEQNAGRDMIEGPVGLRIVCVMAYGAKMQDGMLKATKPDWDNLAKLVCDGLNKAGVWRDDARVAIASMAKLYGSEPRTLILAEPAPVVPGWATAMMLMAKGSTVH